MELQDVRDGVKLQITGDLLNFEMSDETLDKIIDMSLRELTKYYNATDFITVPAKSCIDLKKYPVIGNVVAIYRTNAVGMTSADATMTSDPVSMSQLQMYNMGSSYYKST